MVGWKLGDSNSAASGPEVQLDVLTEYGTERVLSSDNKAGCCCTPRVQ